MTGQAGYAHPAVATFAPVLEREEFRDGLAQVCRREFGWRDWSEMRARALKAHKRRCTFLVDLRRGEEWRRVIAKVHAEDRSDQLEVLMALGRSNLGEDGGFTIPRPFAYLPSVSVLLEEHAPGVAAKETFLTDEGDALLAAAERSARWLARFQAAAPRLKPAMDVREEFPRFERWGQQVAQGGNRLAEKSERLVHALRAALPQSGTAAYCAAHGSFIPEHVLLADGRTTGIDFDEYGVADPARDAGWFAVSVARLALTRFGSLQALSGAVERFLGAYAAAAGPKGTEALAFYTALECLHRARRDVAKRKPPLPEWADLMLNEGLRVLA